jgi:DNA-binding MarR family transcriptional regulator
VRVADIAAALNMTRQSVSQFVAELEEMGYVEKEPDPTDGRASLIRFSGAGLQIMEHALRVKQEIENEVAEAIGPEDYATLIQALNSIDAIYRYDG